MIYRVRKNRKTRALELRIERGHGREWQRSPWKPFTRESMTEDLRAAHVEFAEKYGVQGKSKLAQVKPGGES